MKNVKLHPQTFAGLPYEFQQEIVMINAFNKGELHCVLDTVLECTQVTEDEFFSRRKTADIALARTLFSTVTRELLWTRTKLIGKFMGRDHSTVIHHTRTAKGLVKVDKHFKSLYHRCLVKAETNLHKHGFEYKRQTETYRSRVEASGSGDGSATQRLVFTQTTSR